MEEKLRILKMVENGQISATEAAQLLQATDSRYSGYNTNDGGTADSSSTSLEELGRKFESFARDAAPKVEKFAEVVAGKIAGAADRLSDAFVQHADSAEDSSRSQRSSEKRSPGGGGGTSFEKQIEIFVEAGSHNELSLSGLGGEVRVKGYNGDKITARVSYRARANAPIEMVKLGGKYFLKYESGDFTMVSIDAYVPERAFGVIKLDGMNGVLDVSSLSATEMSFSNANGDIALSNLSAKNITAESSNGRFYVSKITAENASFENLNGPVDADELDVAKLKLHNYNSTLSLIMSKFARYRDYIWNVETGNAKLNINLPSAHDLGYHIKAHAAMGEIRLGLTGMQYLINEPSLVEARGSNFDTAAKKIKMAVETSNAPLLIN
ncbi:MAG: DUF4097 domain-containing protein [Defluviitaleaceae bacterium]|nr:DUF4097 domain-containing protein [Defluviitaleaceae bacterium]